MIEFLTLLGAALTLALAVLFGICSIGGFFKLALVGFDEDEKGQEGTITAAWFLCIVLTAAFAASSSFLFRALS